jgi:hypothetical protein
LSRWQRMKFREEEAAQEPGIFLSRSRSGLGHLCAACEGGQWRSLLSRTTGPRPPRPPVCGGGGGAPV